MKKFNSKSCEEIMTTVSVTVEFEREFYCQHLRVTVNGKQFEKQANCRRFVPSSLGVGQTYHRRQYKPTQAICERCKRTLQHIFSFADSIEKHINKTREKSHLAGSEKLSPQT